MIKRLKFKGIKNFRIKRFTIEMLMNSVTYLLNHHLNNNLILLVNSKYLKLKKAEVITKF